MSFANSEANLIRPSLFPLYPFPAYHSSFSLKLLTHFKEIAYPLMTLLLFNFTHLYLFIYLFVMRSMSTKYIKFQMNSV